ncbi:competence protein CoiA family protein [Paenarthrobacter sp. NPDC057355]|uniref:competence protein CoiA family protein n=1 Tax=Paenarthrobacter sp. NPDC057355 TaxID=3346105 RepID=UPI00363B2BC3
MAKSVLDGTEWTAMEFARLLPEEQRANRQVLACLSCDGRAVFRAGQKRQPSFAARHRQDCRLVTRPWGAFKFLTAAGTRTERARAAILHS